MSDVEATGRWSLVIRSMAVWLVLIAAEIAHGILRAVAVVPLFGQFRSSQIGVLSGSAIILIIACLTVHWIGAVRCRELLLVGLVWLVMTAAFEVLFGRFVMGSSWERIAADYNLMKGGLMPLGLLVMFFSPMIASKLRSSKVGTAG